MNEFENKNFENFNSDEQNTEQNSTTYNSFAQNSETDTAEDTPLNETTQSFDKQADTPEFSNQPVNGMFNPVNFSPVTPVSDYKPVSNGLKIFALIIATVIALTATSLAGFYIGKNTATTKTSAPTNASNIKVNLAATPKDNDELTAAQVFEKVNPSIVGITIYNAEGAGGQASGIVFSKDGYIITNDHIYSEIPNAKFKIHTFDGTEYDAKYVAGDLISDLAVLKIENCKLQPAVFGNSDELFMGQNVVAIGRPNDATDTSSITKGVISALNRRVSNTSNYAARLIQTDSPINPGSSGGALVNLHGQVVGITSAKLASVEYEGVGYAIPTTVMQRIVEELISEGKVVSRAKLGITYASIDSVVAEVNNYSHTGLLVDSVSEDSALYGKIKKDDIITKINDIEITNDDIVLDIIEQCRAGDTITVTVITSNGKTKTFNAELKANVGQSSYTTKNNSQNSSNDGTFEFPIGE